MLIFNKNFNQLRIIVISYYKDNNKNPKLEDLVNQDPKPFFRLIGLQHSPTIKELT